MPFFRRTKRITGRARYQTTQHRRTVAQRSHMRKARPNKMRLFIPFRRKDHALIDYIYMVYYPERAKLTRMPAHANSPTQLKKYEYKFKLDKWSNATFGGTKYRWVAIFGRSCNTAATQLSPSFADNVGQGGALWFTNGTVDSGSSAGDAGQILLATGGGWSKLSNYYGPNSSDRMVRLLACKLTLVPTSAPEKRTGSIGFMETSDNLAWVGAYQKNSAADDSDLNATSLDNYRNNDNCLIYPLAGSTVFHSTWFPCRRQDRDFFPLTSDPSQMNSDNYSRSDFSANLKRYPPGYKNGYFSNMVWAEGCDASEVFECVLTVIHESYHEISEQSHGVATTHADGLSTAGGAHTAAINQHTALGTGGFHNGTGVPLGHVASVTSLAVL